MAKKLIVSGQEFSLEDDTDLDALRAQVAERLRSDSSDPWIKVGKGNTVSWVAVNQHSSVVVEERQPGRAFSI